MFVVYSSCPFAEERPPFACENHTDPGEIFAELHDIPLSAPETLDRRKCPSSTVPSGDTFN